MKTLRKNKNKKGGDVKKKVKFNSPQNKTHKYSVTSEEKKSKLVDKNKSIKKCKTVPQDKSDFPCRFRNTIFNDENEYNEYIELLKERNRMTNYKSRAEHYNNIDVMLRQEFKPKFNI
jgi:hypothetical protein